MFSDRISISAEHKSENDGPNPASRKVGEVPAFYSTLGALVPVIHIF